MVPSFKLKTNYLYKKLDYFGPINVKNYSSLWNYLPWSKNHMKTLHYRWWSWATVRWANQAWSNATAGAFSPTATRRLLVWTSWKNNWGKECCKGPIMAAKSFNSRPIQGIVESYVFIRAINTLKNFSTEIFYWNL